MHNNPPHVHYSKEWVREDMFEILSNILNCWYLCIVSSLLKNKLFTLSTFTN